MMKKQIDRADCRCEFDYYNDGSVLAGTVRSGVRDFRTHLEIDSPEPPEVIAQIIRLAKRGCFAEQMITHATPISSTYLVNGAAQEVDCSDEATRAGRLSRS